MKFLRLLAFIAACLPSIGPAAAQAPVSPPPLVQTADEALAQDAGEYARRYGVEPDEALRRLRAQGESVAATDHIRERYRDRLAGIAIEHDPEYRIVVLLTGGRRVRPQVVRTGAMDVPVVFRTGAAATRGEIVAAMADHRDAIRAMTPGAQGMGLDARTGELVVLVNGSAANRSAALEAELEAVTGVPVRLDRPGALDANLALGGGSRVEGSFPGDGRRYICTTGFAVTDGLRTGVVTAAHCPDALTYYDPQGGEIPLRFEGGWGVGHQDVQVHVGDRPHAPLFYADTAKTAVRRLTGARALQSTRAGDVVCRRGETTGYSCSEVELMDYAPPGELCGGPCDPTWVTVAGPSCRGGDSGGPVFSGTVAFGIVKGANYAAGGRCNFYYYMSTDFLPDGWSLLSDRASDAGPRAIAIAPTTHAQKSAPSKPAVTARLIGPKPGSPRSAPIASRRRRDIG